MRSVYNGKSILVTGGASFIGSHLVDSLLEQRADVVVADDFSSGSISNLDYSLKKKEKKEWIGEKLLVKQGDLRDVNYTKKVLEDIDIVFHLAASHGGRGYIETHPAECCTNMILDQLVFQEAYKAGVDRICFASSACVYPSYLQMENGSSYLLKESDANPFKRDKALADLEYGWAKLMGEMALTAYHRQYGIKTSSVRIFTAYGPRENETHAIIALIAKAFVKQDPYEIWGTGEQDRNFTYVQDIVDALMLSAEKIVDGSAINAGRDDRITVNQAVEIIFDILKWKPNEINHDLTKPQGVLSRAADLTLARNLLNWEPKTAYREGFEKTIRWYLSKKDVKDVEKNLDNLLLER